MKPTVSWIRPMERVLTISVQAMAVTTAMVMISSLILGIFFRYVMGDSLTWTEEVAMLCFSWLTFLAAALMVRENGHVRVELIESIMSPRYYWLLTQLIWILIGLIGTYMAWNGFEFISLTIGQSSPAIRYPIWVRDVSLPVGGILISIYALLNLGAHSFSPISQPNKPKTELES